MAKLCMKEREARRAQLVSKYKVKRDQLRAIIRDLDNDLEDKMAAQKEMQALPRDSSRCRVRNRCFITGRSRGVYRRFGLARSKLRELAMEGMIPGLRKASW
jgi:small subunit ribosomal protein S14